MGSGDSQGSEFSERLVQNVRAGEKSNRKTVGRQWAAGTLRLWLLTVCLRLRTKTSVYRSKISSTKTQNTVKYTRCTLGGDQYNQKLKQL